MLTHHAENGAEVGRVVVLGSGGVVGRWLCAHLEEISQPYIAVDRKVVDLVEADASDKLVGLLQDGDALVFLSTVTPSRARGLSAVQANLAMVNPALAAARSGKLSHFVYLSSDAVYGRYDQLINEASCAEPADPHGAMHRTREILLAEVQALAIIRATLLYGFGDTHNSYGPNRFLASARAESAIRIFGDGEETRDHLFLGDLVRIITSVLQRRSRGVINAASGSSVSYLDLAERIARLYPGTSIERMPRGGAVTHRHFDMTALIKAFPGFAMTSLDEGLRLTKAKHDEAVQ